MASADYGRNAAAEAAMAAACGPAGAAAGAELRELDTMCHDRVGRRASLAGGPFCYAAQFGQPRGGGSAPHGIQKKTLENMRFAKSIPLVAVALVLSCWMTACGSGSSTAAPAYVRVVNLDTVSSVTLDLNVTQYGVNAGPQSSSGYLQVTAGVYEGEVVSGNTLITSTPFPGLDLASNQYYSIISYPREGVLYPYQLVDNVGVPGAGLAQLAVANAAPDAGRLDVYAFVHGSNATGDPCTSPSLPALPAFSSVQGQQTGAEQLPVTNGTSTLTYDLCVTGPSAPGDERFSASSVPLASTGIYTLVLTSAAGGTLVNGALVVQNGGVTVLNNSSFRVRVLGAQGANPAALATVGGVALPSVTSGIWTPYVTIPLSGQTQPTVSVTVGGNTVQLAVPQNFTFGPGQDYSIVVYGTTTPAAVLLVDDNHLKVNDASVRLVNAADSMPMYFTIAGQSQLFTAVPLAGSSKYVSVSPISNAPVYVRSSDVTAATPGGATVLSNFSNGYVYTVLFYDLNQPPIVVTDKAGS